MKIQPSRPQSCTTNPPVIQIPRAFTDAEGLEFQRCENVLDRGLDTVFQVGQALLTIRDRHLYRRTHDTFEAYCRERWGIGRTYAWRVIGAAERMRLLPEGDFPRPANEFQVRPFLKLKPEAFAPGWAEVLRLASDGKPTPKLIRAVARGLTGDVANRCVSSSKRRRARNCSRPQLGRIVSLVLETKRRVQSGHTESVLSILDEIQEMLLK